MFKFGFANMRFEQGESINFNDCPNLDPFKDEDKIEWREMVAPNHFPSFDFDDEDHNQQIYDSNRDKVDVSLNKKDKCSQTKSSHHKNKESSLEKKEINTSNKENAEIEETKEQFTSLCTPEDNITNVQFEKPENLICKGSMSGINKDINADKAEDSLEYLKELMDKKKFKADDKQRRFGRNDDRELFVILKELCRVKHRDICDFLTSGFEADIVLKEILTEAHQRTNFKGDKVYLLKRIQKLVSNQTFSVRENKLLKNLVGVQLQTNKLNFSQIEYFLPGKKSEIVRREVGRLMLQI